MARQKIDWDLWLDRPFAKLWITIIAVIIIGTIFAGVTTILLILTLSNSQFKYLLKPTIIMFIILFVVMVLQWILQIIYAKKTEELFKYLRKKNRKSI